MTHKSLNVVLWMRKEKTQRNYVVIDESWRHHQELMFNPIYKYALMGTLSMDTCIYDRCTQVSMQTDVPIKEKLPFFPCSFFEFSNKLTQESIAS